MLHIYVDADACPVKQEVYRVAKRCGLEVTLVANSWMRVPDERWLKLEVVGEGFDEADDWIVEHVQPDDIVITADIPLASRCLKNGARVIGSTGKPFTEDNMVQLSQHGTCCQNFVEREKSRVVRLRSRSGIDHGFFSSWTS